MSRLRDPYFRERFAEITADFPLEQWQGRTIRRRVPIRGATRQRKPMRTSALVREALTSKLRSERLKATARAAARRLQRAMR